MRNSLAAASADARDALSAHVSARDQSLCFKVRRGARLGKGDHIVEWPRPQHIRSIDWQTLKALPERLTMRETRTQVAQPGFRSRTIIAQAAASREAYKRLVAE